MPHVQKDIAEQRRLAAIAAQKAADLRKAGKSKDSTAFDVMAKEHIKRAEEMRLMLERK